MAKPVRSGKFFRRDRGKKAQRLCDKNLVVQDTGNVLVTKRATPGMLMEESFACGTDQTIVKTTNQVNVPQASKFYGYLSSVFENPFDEVVTAHQNGKENDKVNRIFKSHGPF
ncbi:MAG: hypothetical protein ACRESZ_13180 [Methylococcales bacterium]